MKIISIDKGFYAIILGLFLWCPARANTVLASTGTYFFQQQVHGTVTDASGPLPGVIIAVKGKNIAVNSDTNGNYTIAASAGDTLIFSFIGFKRVEKTVSSGAINVVMEPESSGLEEVVINTGYYTVKDKQRTGSISRITSKDIGDQPVTNVLATMQGRMAGVDIIQDGGSPGGSFQIKIRGINSLRRDGNQPLYVIDGVPYSSETIGSPDTSTSTASFTSPLNSINPSDIESIEVLKDADATSIYGSRGANGVVLITTKKGKIGKTSVNVLASTAIGKVTKMIDLMQTPEYLEMRRQAFANDGIDTYPDFAYDINGTWDQNRNTDWQKELIGGTAHITSAQLSLSGGSENTQYLLSGTYRSETTVTPGDFRYDKGAAHFNMNHRSQDNKFRLAVTANYTSQDNNLPSTDLTAISRKLAPNAPKLYNEDGSLNWEDGTFENPLAALESKASIKTNDLLANTLMSYELFRDFEVKLNLGFTDLSNNEERIMPSTMYNPAYGIGSSESLLLTNLTSRKSWIAEPQLHWKKDMAGGVLDVLAGATAQQQQSKRLYQIGYGFSSNSLIYDLASAGAVFTTANDEAVYRYQAFFGRLNYNWQDRYIINLTGRRDGSSRFGPGKQFASFGAVGMAWLFSNEAFLNGSKVLSFGKLRASYGTTGNDQIGDYQFLNSYASSGIAYQGVIGLTPQRLYNPDFSWEVNKKLEMGLEMGFLKNRVSLSVAHYRNRSSNQLVGIPLPGTTGFASVNANLAATVQNTGFEFTLGTTNVETKDFNWTSSLNLTIARNKLIEFPGLESSPYANTYIIGQSLNIARLYHYTGLNEQTGVYQVQDFDGDGAITAANDKQVIADLTPKFFGGFQNQLSYKNWKLDFLFQFTKQKNYDYIPSSAAGLPYNQPSGQVFWQQSGDKGPQQITTTGANSAAVAGYYQYAASDAVIVDGSYIRLKNIALSYNLPSEALGGIRCRLFFQGQNLLTFTPYEGGDPEFKYAGYLPPLKIYSLGAQLTF
ncbi:SusC/RagA family TonB-linked outer membrane protein [Flavobacterium beibuense]|uniref:SusC-like TonB-dependent receptor n=1 Tax=Flavobacterium beibuense TaxID=657326 RepID=A0A444WET9_9FLAO|nr:SusC/RagA family TonB-linked outer membrane protein [Flavobacterium beibuense]RYJ44286.1 SusC-like TonB-dependent receptor [Flavobacterium beibuense]